jgi:hypothetical protein
VAVTIQEALIMKAERKARLEGKAEIESEEEDKFSPYKYLKFVKNNDTTRLSCTCKLPPTL